MNRDELELEILELENRLLAGQAASDGAELDALLADDLVFVSHTGQIVTKAMDLAAHRAGALKIARSEVTDRELRFLADAAVVISRVSLAGSFDGQPFEGDFRYTRVWQRGAQGWQVVAGQMGVVI